MNFWAGKRVLVTGHTGFKGSWLCRWLLDLGSVVSGYALPPQANQLLFGQLGLADAMNHATGDIRDGRDVAARIAEIAPEIVFHMAAQPLVLESYDDPLGTWQTNVMGSVHVMEALRALGNECTLIMVTTDKVYENREWWHAYRETDRLGGADPYSASKAAMEIAVACWRRAFFADSRVRMASARAGNVIGGGDWAADRIVPDIVRALQAGETIPVRNPHAIRPFQHVLEPLAGYMRLAERLMCGPAGDLADAYNFGPESADQISVRQLVDTALTHWPGRWEDRSNPTARHEAGILTLDIQAARHDLGYVPRWDAAEAIARTMEWYRRTHEGDDPLALTQAQIEAFGPP